MRLTRFGVGLVIAAGLTVVGCQTDGPTDIDSVPDLSSVASLQQQATQPRHLVLFKNGNGAPADFGDAVAELGGVVDGVLSQIGAAAVSGLSDEAAAQLATLPDVDMVGPEFDIALDDPVEIETAAAGDVVASPDDPAAAFFFGRQWGLRAISADLAWAAGYLGSPDVTVAILDTGIDYTYPDLIGLVDLSRSASFVPADDALVQAFFPGRDLITDLRFHGTHVANTVVSHANVVAGVTSKTTLIGVKVCSVFGSCPFFSVISGIIHAADNGADIANMSLGGGFPKSGGNGFFIGNFINRAMNYARSQGTLVVVSAGNAASDLDHNGNFFASYCDSPNVACVSATGPTFAPSTAGPFVDVDTPSPFTNFGRSAISVAAPGGNGAAGIGGFVWQACSQTSLVIPICQTGTFILGVTGTSMSAPHASGVAALLVARYGGTPTSIRSKLQQTADDLGQPGTDPFYGNGRVNAAAAVGLQ